MVLIFSDIQDIHSQVVKKRLEVLGERVIVLSTRDYPQQWSITTTLSSCTFNIGEESININEFKGIWNRRYQVPLISKSIIDNKTRKFALNESECLISSISAFFDGNEINNSFCDKQSELKPIQLYYANKCGLKIPETIISSNYLEILEFSNKYNKLIFKPLTNTSFQFTDTRILEKNLLENYNKSIPFAPTIFQKYIEGPYHIRTTIVDNEIFSAKVRNTNPTAEIDWRLDPLVEINPYFLPSKVNKKLIKLMQLLNLRYGAIDLKKSHDGEYYFFEVNPAGQFLFTEIEANLGISESIVKALLK